MDGTKRVAAPRALLFFSYSEWLRKTDIEHEYEYEHDQTGSDGINVSVLSHRRMDHSLDWRSLTCDSMRPRRAWMRRRIGVRSTSHFVVAP